MVKWESQVHFKGGNTIRSLLVALRDKDNITQKSEVIYRYVDDTFEYDIKYIGESARTFGERPKDDLGAPFPICDHANTVGHHTRVDFFSIVDRESHNITRTINDAMYIRVDNPLLNRNFRKYQLSDI